MSCDIKYAMMLENIFICKRCKMSYGKSPEIPYSAYSSTFICACGMMLKKQAPRKMRGTRKADSKQAMRVVSQSKPEPLSK